MTFFEILSDLFYNKKNIDTKDQETLQQFTPYLVNRWLSFYDNNKAVFVNETINKFTGLFDDKNDMYNFYLNLIPKSRFKKINYIKKNKNKKEEEDNNISVIAKNKNISKREVALYIDLIKIKSI